MLLRLNLSTCWLGSKGGITLVKSLAENSTLQDLDLSDNKLDVHVGKPLANALKINRTLISLNLSRNRLFQLSFVDEQVKNNTDHTKSLITAKRYKKQKRDLQEFTLIASEGITLLIEALKVNRALKQLNLADNALGKEVGVHLKRLLSDKNCSLTHLNLSTNNIREAGMIPLASGLLENHSLINLNLSRNFLGVNGVSSLRKVLAENETLQVLGISEFRDDEISDFFQENSRNHRYDEQRRQNNLNQNVLAIENNPDDANKIKEFLARNKELAKQAQAKINKSKSEIHSSANDRHEEKKEESLRGRTVSQISPASNSEVVPSRPFASSLSARAVRSKSIDANSIEKLSQLDVNKLSLIAESIKLFDASALKTLQGRAEELKSMFEREVFLTKQEDSIDRINKQSYLKAYYDYFSRAFTGTWLACQTINTGMVGNIEKYKSDYFADGLNEIGKHIPVVSIGTGILSGLITSWNNVEKKKLVQKMALLFPDLQSAFSQISELTRELTLEQSNLLAKKSGESLSLIEKAKAKILIQDLTNPVQIKAIEDCEKLVKAIKDEIVSNRSSRLDFMKIIMGQSYSPVSNGFNNVSPSIVNNVSVSVSAVSVSVMSLSQNNFQAQSDNNLYEELRKMRKENELRDAQVKELVEKNNRLEEVNKLMAKKMKDLDDSGASGFSGGQIQLNPSARPKDIGVIVQDVERLNDQVQTLHQVVTKETARQDEQVAALSVQDQKIKDLEKKGHKQKDCCIVS